MKALELKTILDFMLASANLRDGAYRKEQGVYVEMARGGLIFTAIQDGIVTKVKTRPKNIRGESFTMFLPVDDIKNILPSLAYEIKDNEGQSTVYLTKSTQPLTGADSLRFEVGGWFDAHQGDKVRAVPKKPSVRTNNSGPLDRQAFLHTFLPLTCSKSSITDEPALDCHRSKIFKVFHPRFNLLEVSRTVFY